MTRVSVLAVVGLGMVVTSSWADSSAGRSAGEKQVLRTPVKLSKEHIAAVNRPRRVFVNADESFEVGWLGGDIKEFVETRFALFDEPGSHVDSVAWCFDEGNLAYYPSKVLAVTKSPALKKWLDAGIDYVKVMVAESHKRKMEVFWAYRISGGEAEWDRKPFKLPIKEQHPDWLIPYMNRWNYAVPELRAYKLASLRELAENYDFDGIDIDFSRFPPTLPFGEQWLHRDAMTDFIRRVRATFQEVAHKRGRPLLLSVRVAENVPGCHYDGLDIETWARENLIDILFIGSRSIDVDLAGFRRALQGRNIKLIPSYDDFHTTDGYGRSTEGRHPPIEFLRGVYGNWWHQGADAVQTFNFHHVKPGQQYFVPQQQQAYHEIGDPEVMRLKDKMFVVQRRYGGDAPKTWDFYIHVNPHGPLPATLAADGFPSIQTLYVCDDLAAVGDRLKDVQLRLRLSGEPATDAIEVKLNGVRLSEPKVGKLAAGDNWVGVEEDGWWIFAPPPKAFAAGPNLVSIRLRPDPPPTVKPVAIEKLEAHVRYK